MAPPLSTEKDLLPWAIDHEAKIELKWNTQDYLNVDMEGRMRKVEESSASNKLTLVFVCSAGGMVGALASALLLKLIT